MTDTPRLIDFAFPLKQASLDSVHEKNVRHGHISTLHIWPARRPLAACRAALIATLLPDPGTPEARRELCEKIGGTVVKRVEKKKMPGGQVVEREKEETEGGILHWGRETENAETLEWFRQEIRRAYGGRAPKVLDPFAGGGAIPLEAMRLGCEATAIDINPVAWFILKCTLEYPQKLAGQKRPLPDFILTNRAFMESFFKAQGLSKAEIRRELERLGHADQRPSLPGIDAAGQGIEADLAWHVRAWGQWVLARARKELAPFYPVYADFEPLDPHQQSYERQPMRQVPLSDDGTQNLEALNGEFSADYLAVKSNPRWVAKPTVAYLWARTVTCKNCRATIPLLKTRWLCRKDRKRVVLTMTASSDKSGVIFGIGRNVPISGSNAAQRREHDKKVGAGTMSRAGAKCPCCETITTMEDIRLEGRAGRMNSSLSAVVVNGREGKSYRLPTEYEIETAAVSGDRVAAAFGEVPFVVPDEQMPSAEALGMRAPLYGLDRWARLFTARQLATMGDLIRATRATRDQLRRSGAAEDFAEAINAYLSLVLGRTVNYLSTVCLWDSAAEEVKQTFLRFALPITWDYAEANPLSGADRYYSGGLSSVARVLDELLSTAALKPEPAIINESAIAGRSSPYDVIVTDPPYYDAIPYSDLMDFFYVWLRRSLYGASAVADQAFSATSSPKWDRDKCDGELIDESSRHGGCAVTSRRVYEEGMARAFASCARSLSQRGRLVIVFANKRPEAWEALVSALITAGFVVDGSWPIATEMRGGVRNFSRASLASSVWLVCRKRDSSARPGWDKSVLDEMRANIGRRLREFWDAGIRGPDFVWAATGPALEAYSKHPVVKMADDPGRTLTVSEFLNHARRMVVDYVVGRVLAADPRDAAEASIDRLDEVTAYYLLHRNDFGLDEAPVGACILYATACGLSDEALVRDWDLLAKTGGEPTATVELDADSDDSDEPVEETGSGGKVKLKAWNQRRGRSLGFEAPGGRTVPLVDRIHRLMQLWKAGDVHRVDEYLDEHGLRRHELFRRVLQSLIELAKTASEERSLLESLSNHVGAKGARTADPQRALAYEAEE